MLAEIPLTFAINSIGISLKTYTSNQKVGIYSLIVDENFYIPVITILIIFFIGKIIRKKYVKMCGIFGFSKKIELENFENIFNDIKKIVNLSQTRGSDTFGISFYNKNKNFVYKINQKPNLAIKEMSLKFLLNNLISEKNNELILIGQNRLVTNGSKFSYVNNQPLITKNVVGVHNGIFTNLDQSPTDKTINYEAYNVKSDSLIFFEKLSKIAENNKFLKNYINYIDKIIGNYSIAYFLKNERKIFLSSNCGSLYYSYENNFFCFASEKKNFTRIFK